MTGEDILRFQDPIQVYTRRITPTIVPPLTSVSSPMQESSETITAQLPGSYTIDDFPIALRKENMTQHPIFTFVSFSHLSSAFCLFISSLDSCSVPKNVLEIMSIPD